MSDALLVVLIQLIEVEAELIKFELKLDSYLEAQR